MACRSSWARDQTHTTAVTWATEVTTAGSFTHWAKRELLLFSSDFKESKTFLWVSKSTMGSVLCLLYLTEKLVLAKDDGGRRSKMGSSLHGSVVNRPDWDPWGCGFNSWPWYFGKDLALVFWQGFGIAMSCGVGHRCGLDPEFLWLWCRPAVALIWPQPANLHMLWVRI